MVPSTDAAPQRNAEPRPAQGGDHGDGADVVDASQSPDENPGRAGEDRGEAVEGRRRSRHPATPCRGSGAGAGAVAQDERQADQRCVGGRQEAKGRPGDETGAPDVEQQHDGGPERPARRYTLLVPGFRRLSPRGSPRPRIRRTMIAQLNATTRYAPKATATSSPMPGASLAQNESGLQAAGCGAAGCGLRAAGLRAAGCGLRGCGLRGCGRPRPRPRPGPCSRTRLRTAPLGKASAVDIDMGRGGRNEDPRSQGSRHRGGRGLGREFAMQFLDAGARVMVCDVVEADLQASAEEAKTRGKELPTGKCDVTNEEDVRKTFATMVEGLGDRRPDQQRGHHAGRDVRAKKDGEIKTMSVDQWRKVIDVNLTGVFLCAREAVTWRCARGNPGVVINILGFGPATGQANYSTTKAGVVAFTIAIARSWRARGSARRASLRYTATEMVLSMPRRAGQGRRPSRCVASPSLGDRPHRPVHRGERLRHGPRVRDRWGLRPGVYRLVAGGSWSVVGDDRPGTASYRLPAPAAHCPSAPAP